MRTGRQSIVLNIFVNIIIEKNIFLVVNVFLHFWLFLKFVYAFLLNFKAILYAWYINHDMSCYKYFPIHFYDSILFVTGLLRYD